MPDQAGVQKHLGKPLEKAHAAFVADIIERHDFFVGQLATPWEDSVRFHKHYLTKRDDLRSEEQRWRANVKVPEPYAVTETRTAVLTNILLAPDPPIQPDAVGEEDLASQRHIERLLAYTLRKNLWRKLLMGWIRMSSIQGTEFYSLTWTNRVQEIKVYADKASFEDFQARLAEGFSALGVTDPSQIPDWTTDPVAFNVWREMVNTSGQAKIPEIPSGGKKEMVRYRGPLLERIPDTDLRYDPLIDEIQNQGLVVKRLLKSKSWIEQRTGKEKDKPFDPEMVKECLGVGSDAKISDVETRINNMLGIPSGETDPQMKNMHEVWECWQPGAELPYAIILNRRGVINKDPSQMPYIHNEINILGLRNVWVPGRMRGISDHQPVESLYEELDSLRSLRLDRTAMETLPAFTKLTEMGMPELKRQLKPGALIPTSRPGMLDQLIKYSATNAFAELDRIQNDIANATTAYQHVKGAPVSVNRVSATESQGREEQALGRIKLSAIMAEEDLSPMVGQMLALWYQKGDPEQRIRVGGGPDPFLSIDREVLLEAMDMDYRFRGATQVLNRPLLAQQLGQYLKDFGSFIIPTEMRDGMKQLLETLGIKGIAKLVSDMGTDYYMDLFTIQQRQVAAQLNPPPAPPAQVDAGTAAAIQGEAPAQAPPQQAPAQAAPVAA